MDWQTIAVILVVAVTLVLFLRAACKSRRNASCGGDCGCEFTKGSRRSQ